MIKEFKDEFRWLSNFTPVKISLCGMDFPSVEHAYQSMKNNDIGWKTFCQQEPSPAKVRKQSREVSLIPNWNDIKDNIMLNCLRQKFQQQPFRGMLIATIDEEIQEGNWWGDAYWGVDLKTGQGQNKLGKMIMQIRKELTNI